eukprot:CAMPEP_0185847826 /NCGR_PEP_ID=MMETSP1354-20130828/2942_1 /TAXON_ID=708628 /ORGANISM="Erythrolobus madagascarensis, Strain CCMP3276" /LENGTH=405 /DNA_ID=CAMNT_0028548157 /DNA_START=192 /DNA_END=1409 /DNA_ORIENTATION=+
MSRMLARVSHAIAPLERCRAVAGRGCAVPLTTRAVSTASGLAEIAVDDKAASFEFRTILGYRCEPPKGPTTASEAQLKAYFRLMLTMRRMEIASDVLYKAQFIRGFCHLYDGQEAVQVGLEAALNYEDCIITSYRNHCQQLARGSTVKEVLAELTGRAAGCTQGKGGSMHMYKSEHRYYGGQGIVGAQTPLGAGLAFALKYRGVPNVAVTMFGDGAANQGQLAEAINMASLWKLPCIFLCENNRYGMGTSTARASGSGDDFYQRGSFIPGIKIDGMDVLAVREGMKFAKQVALEHGPIYVEVDTYRYHGHSMSDPGVSYRSRTEISDIRGSRDPIDRVKGSIIEQGWATVEEMKALEKEVKKEVDHAVQFAKSSPEPEPKETFTHVFTEPINIRGTNSFNGYTAS